MTAGRRTSTGGKAFLLIPILVVLALRIAPAQVPREVVLRPEAVPDELERVNWIPEKPGGPFQKEPELSQRRVFRHVLRFGKDTNNAFALIWDQPKHKLYLDLNHNLDLTDDPRGVFTSTVKRMPQLFKNVTLPLKTAVGPYSATVDFQLFTDEAGDSMQVQLTSRTIWQAKVALEGEEWQVAVIDKLLGAEKSRWQVAAFDKLLEAEEPGAGKFLLLRPWTVRTNQISLETPLWGTVPFPSQLFWLGKPFQLERRFETAGDGPVCKLVLTPQQPPLAALKLSGDSLCYAVLQATNGYTLVLPGPARTWQVPEGVYALRTVWLKQGATEAYRRDPRPLSVNATTATNVAIGGPLTNSVLLERYGRRLVIGHIVKGANGDEYRLVQEYWQRRPEFAVYHGGKKVFASKFQYG